MNQHTQMEIIVKDHGNILEIKLLGRLDVITSPKAERRIIENIRTGSKNFIMNFSGIEYISSAGLRMLKNVSDQIQKSQGRIVFYNINANTMNVFELTGFDQLFEIVENEDDAFIKLSK